MQLNSPGPALPNVYPRMPPPNFAHRPIHPNAARPPFQQPLINQQAPPHLGAYQPGPILPAGVTLQQRAIQLSNIEQGSYALAQRVLNLQRETQALQQQISLLERDRQGIASATATDAPVPPPPPRYTGLPHIPGLPLPNGGLPGPPPNSSLPEHPAQHNSLPPHIRELLAQQARLQNNPSSNPASQAGQGGPGMSHPDHTATFTQEGVGPNGQRWHVSINQTTTTIPITQAPQQAPQNLNQPQPGNMPDVQAILRRFDRQGLRHRQDSMQRSASNPPPSTRDRPAVVQAPNTQPSTPGAVTNPILAALNASTGPNPTVPAFAANTSLAGNSIGVNTPADPTVYILSSPQGPRGLLVSNANTFYTPRTSTRTSSRRNDATTTGRSTTRDNAQQPERRVHRQHRHRPPRREAAAGEQPAAAAHPANPGAGVVAAQVWPMIWLIIRLGIFVWFFTAGHNSWSRTFVVTAAALVIFIINTGVFNGAAEQVWGPVRRHLEGLLPLAGPDPPADADQPQQGDGAAPIAGGQANIGRNGEPDPAQVAARLLEQRRRQTGWIMTQIRRAEHSMLLFLASLVPGVGERHIAARERETAAAAEAQRQRENASPPQAATEGAAREQDSGANGQSAQEGNVGNEHAANGGNHERREGAAEPEPMIPLIEA